MKIPIRRIQIYGERCTGTNYLEHLLNKNLVDVPVKWNFGWKHFFHKEGVEAADDCLFVIMYRNPFSWLKSMYRKPCHAAFELRNIDFSEFIRKEWWCIWDENSQKKPGDEGYGEEMMFERCPDTQKRFKSIIKMRSAKIKNWESLRKKTKHSIYIQYEKLNSNPKAFIQLISDKFSIPKENNFQNIRAYKGRNWYTNLKSKLFQDIKPIYKTIVDEDIEFIGENLDGELEANIGYDISELVKQLKKNG